MKRVLPLAVLLVLTAACGTEDHTPRASGIPTTSTTATTLAPISFEQQPEAKVLADCRTFEARPAEIIGACGDAGIIFDGLTWDTWSGSQATGRGTVHAKLCEPDCASGGLYEGAVDVVLDKPVDGVFSEVVVDWKGADPFGKRQDAYSLPTEPLD